MPFRGIVTRQTQISVLEHFHIVLADEDKETEKESLWEQHVDTMLLGAGILTVLSALFISHLQLCTYGVLALETLIKCAAA